MRIYLDNNATTPVQADVLDALDRSLRNAFGNASSIHKEGQTARQVIEEAREAVAHLAGAAPRDLVFTSGGTESNNAAIFGAVPLLGRHHIVTTAIEHPSVLEPVAELERRGHSVTRVAPGRDGRVEAAAVLEAIRAETRLVAMMLANNETGVIQPVGEVAAVCRARAIHIHCDAVQAAGKMDLDVMELAVDTASFSGHKLHAPKGIGALYVRRGLGLQPHLLGGAQERRRRAGTENVPLAAAFGVSAALPPFRAELAAMRDTFEAVLLGLPGLPAITINGAAVERIPNTSSVTFEAADAEGIVIALDLSGIAVSTGSACSSGRIEPSHVLLAMGMTPAEAKSTVRFSLGRTNTAAELERTAAVLRDVVPRCVR